MTIKDIACESGYAVTTVSRVLNGQPNVSKEARERILEVVRRHNFSLNTNAKRLKQQGASGVAVIVKGYRNMLFASIVERLQSLLDGAGYTSIFHYIDEEADEVEVAVRAQQNLRPQAIMFLGGMAENFARGFAAVTVPCVLLTCSAESLDFPNLSSITTDDCFAAECAVEHLMSLGHRSIGVLGGPLDSSNPASRRYDGCLRAFNRHRMRFDDERQLVASRFSMADGYEAMGRLLEKMPELTAVFAMSDVTAIGAIRAIRDAGRRVPEDISVMGFDGIDLGGYLTPKLATIKQDGALIAELSVDILSRAMEGAGEPVHEVVPFRLVRGESAGTLSR